MYSQLQRQEKKINNNHNKIIITAVHFSKVELSELRLSDRKKIALSRYPAQPRGTRECVNNLNSRRSPHGHPVQ